MWAGNACTTPRRSRPALGTGSPCPGPPNPQGEGEPQFSERSHTQRSQSNQDTGKEGAVPEPPQELHRPGTGLRWPTTQAH